MKDYITKFFHTKHYVRILTLIIITTITSNFLITDYIVIKDYSTLIHYVSFVCFGLLFIDYNLNVIVTNNIKKYIFSFNGIIDFIASIPFFMEIFSIKIPDLELILVVASFLKLSRFSPALSILKDVMISERKPLISSLYIMLLLTFISSTILYFLERDVNPNGFSSIPQSLWWAIVTLGTVGYGDVVPITPIGKIVGGFSAILGLGMFALPAGILANGFAAEVKLLREVASWNMIADVPLFKTLKSDIISEMVSELKIRRFIRNQIIIKEGDIGTSMYFILDGEVEVKNAFWRGKLKSGNFFGEIALIYDVPRTATVTAKTRCELLELTSLSFKKIIAHKEEILKEIEEVAKKRYMK